MGLEPTIFVELPGPFRVQDALCRRHKLRTTPYPLGHWVFRAIECWNQSYSLRGSNPRPMAHKTIALTTELREPRELSCKWTQACVVSRTESHRVQGNTVAARTHTHTQGDPSRRVGALFLLERGNPKLLVAGEVCGGLNRATRRQAGNRAHEHEGLQGRQ